MKFQTFAVLVFSTLMTCTVFAQQHDREIRKMDPETLATLHADFAKYVRENNIDLSKPHPEPGRQHALKRAANDVRILTVLASLAQNDNLIEKLELVERQETEVHEILQQFQKLRDDLQLKNEGASEVSKLQYENQFLRGSHALTQQLAEVLVPFQLLALFDSTIRNGGLLELLTEPGLTAEFVDLSEEQKRQLIQKQQKLGREVHEFIREKRLEQSRIYEEILTRKQRERLIKMVGAEQVSRSFEEVTAEVLIHKSGLNLKLKDHMGPKIDTWRDIEKKLKK